jgi:predicted HicB family RNase H-like nuclease
MSAGMAVKKTPTNQPEQKFVLRLPESLHHALRHVSIDRKTSLNALIVEVLEGWWAKQPERSKYAQVKVPSR